jgi:hypothetical protein
MKSYVAAARVNPMHTESGFAEAIDRNTLGPTYYFRSSPPTLDCATTSFLFLEDERYANVCTREARTSGVAGYAVLCLV